MGMEQIRLAKKVLNILYPKIINKSRKMLAIMYAKALSDKTREFFKFININYKVMCMWKYINQSTVNIFFLQYFQVYKQ